MTSYTKVSGSWKRTPFIWQKIGGVWLPFIKGHVNIGGVWKLFHEHFDAILTVEPDEVPPPYGYLKTAFGNLSPALYYPPQLGLGTTVHEVTRIVWGSTPDGNGVLLTLSGATLDDTDDTFKSIIVNGEQYNRSSRTGTSASAPLRSWWWIDAVNPLGESGDVDFKMRWV